MAIPESYRSNFNTLTRACHDGNLAIVECTDKATGKMAVVVCAIGKRGNEREIVPLARMFDENPYNLLDPPTVEENQGSNQREGEKCAKDKISKR